MFYPGADAYRIHTLEQSDYSEFLLECLLSGIGVYEYGDRVVVIADDKLQMEHMYNSYYDTVPRQVTCD